MAFCTHNVVLRSLGLVKVRWSELHLLLIIHTQSSSRRLAIVAWHWTEGGTLIATFSLRSGAFPFPFHGSQFTQGFRGTTSCCLSGPGYSLRVIGECVYNKTTTRQDDPSAWLHFSRVPTTNPPRPPQVQQIGLFGVYRKESGGMQYHNSREAIPWGR